MPEKDSTHGRQSTAEAKGKGRELQAETTDDKVAIPDRIWLGTDTPYKGPNKWFGGGRLRNHESSSSASQIVSGVHKTDQNILFSIATPQLPAWATDTPTNPRPSKPTQKQQQLKQWPDREALPHLSRMSEDRRLTKNRPYNNPPDDEGDDDEDDEGDRNSRSNRHR